MITEGIAAFVNLSETEFYNGRDTGAYTITLTLDDERAQALEDEGVNLKEYKNQKQRKFKTKKDDFEVVDVDGNPTARDIPYGSKVRVQFFLMEYNGIKTPYFQKVKVLELAEGGLNDNDDEEF